MNDTNNNESKNYVGSSKIYAAADYCDKFWKSNASIMFIVLLAIVTTSIQVLLFMFGKVSINDIWADDSNSWIAWFVIVISLISMLSFGLGNVYTQRESKYFIYFSIVGLLLTIANLFLTKSYLLCFTQIVSFILMIQRYFLYAKEHSHVQSGGTSTPVSKRTITMVWIISGLYLLLSLLVVAMWGDAMYNPNNLPNDELLKPRWTWWIDAISSGTIIASVLLVSYKNKYGIIFSFLGPFIAAFMFAEAGQIISMITMFMLAGLAVTRFLSWMARDMRIKELQQNSN